MLWGEIIIGFLAGGFIGMNIMAMLISKRREEDKMDKYSCPLSKSELSGKVSGDIPHDSI